MEKRGFKGVWIPREIWLHTGLTIQEKVMLVEIDSLDNDNGCWAQNKYFADFFGLSERRVRTIIKSLKDKGFIDIGYTYKPGTKEIEKRVIRITPSAYPKLLVYVVQETTTGAEGNDHTPPEGNDHTPRKETTRGGEENGQENNTLTNNTVVNNTRDNKGASANADAQGDGLDSPNFSPELKAKVEEWIQYKKEQRKPYKPTGLRNLLTQIKHNAEKYGDHAVAEVIAECMAANYQGIIFDKLKSKPRVDQQPPVTGAWDDWDPNIIYAQ